MTDEHAPDWDPYRSLLRLAGGALSVAAERVRDIEQRFEEDAGVDAAPGYHHDMESLVALLMGLASEAPTRVGAVVDGAGRVAGPVLRVAEPLGAALSGTAVGRFAATVAAMSGREAARLAGIGRAEIARGRRLVGEVYDESVHGVLSNLGESEALEELVADQALGVTRGAVQEVRETGAAADWLTESIFRRVVGRSRRTVPPKPAGAA